MQRTCKQQETFEFLKKTRDCLALTVEASAVQVC